MPEAKTSAELVRPNEEKTAETSTEQCNEAEKISAAAAGNASPSSIHRDASLVPKDDVDELSNLNPS